MEGRILRLAALAAIAVLATGCLKKLPAFSCSDDASCGPGGVCETNGFCSFADATCESGRRYGDQSGRFSDLCVGGVAPPTDGSVDTPTDCPGDVDCDNVADQSDNCMAVANEDQHDEDGDGRGDVCDICPAFADTGQDADGDLVGDDCDPHPNTPGDVLEEFAGFQVMPAGWVVDGSFVIVGDDAVGTSPANGAPSMLQRPAPTGDTYTIWAAATLDDIASTALGAIGLTAISEPGTDDHLLCQIVGEAAGAQQELRLFDTSGTGFGLLDAEPHQFPEGISFELFFERNGGFFACDATNPAASVIGNATFFPNNARVGLRTRSATARYHWVMVIRSP